MRTRLLGTAVTVVCCALLLIACGNQGDQSESSATKLKVGGVLSLTGGAAAYGGDAEKGARLAVERLENRHPGLGIDFSVLDDKSDKTEAARVARQLIDVNRVDVILGPAISPSALSVGKLCEERGVPMVGTSPTQDEVTASATYNRQYVSRICFNDSYQGLILAKFAVQDLKLETAAIIFDKTLSYSIGLSNTFRSEFEKLGGRVLYEENYSVSDTDYSALIDKAASFDVDLLFIPGWDENVGPMLRQAGNKWDKFVLLGGDAWPSKRLLELAGGNIKDAYALSHFLDEDPAKEVQDFVQAYEAKYGAKPSPFAALGYDAMMLIFDASQRAVDESPAALKDAINTTSGLKLVTGEIAFDEFRNPQKDVVVVRIYPDKIQFFKRITPE